MSRSRSRSRTAPGSVSPSSDPVPTTSNPTTSILTTSIPTTSIWRVPIASFSASIRHSSIQLILDLAALHPLLLQRLLQRCQLCLEVGHARSARAPRVGIGRLVLYGRRCVNMCMRMCEKNVPTRVCVLDWLRTAAP